MSIYKSSKEYDRSYIWGQLVGWFKQTVDKPNASLSADRRGTLSIPDLESFIVTQKNQSELITKTRRKKKGDGDSEDEAMNYMTNAESKSTRSRPRGKAAATGATNGTNNINQQNNE